MKRLLAGALALFSALTFGATLNPIQLLNPAGSTSGQVIASTGATSAPSWTTVTPAGIGGLTAANNLSDVASATAALTNLGGLSTTTAASTYLTQANAASTYGTKASPLSQFAATTSAQLAGVLSDETGTGAAVFATGAVINPTSTGLATPGPGSFTTVSATGLISPASTVGIKGTVTNDNAQAGSVGESATSSAAGVSLTSNSTATITTVSLTAGDWLVYGLSGIAGAGGALITNSAGGISTTAATLGAFGTFWQLTASLTANGVASMPIVVRLKLASTTTVYCVAVSTFSAGTTTGSCVLNATRLR